MKTPFHILIIEDNADDRADIRQMLLRGSDVHYRFTEATTGAAGLRACREVGDAAPDLVLLDFYLPDLDGELILAELRGEAVLTPFPVVVLTGSDTVSGPAMLRAGAQDYIGKSWITPESLTHTIENAVERFRLLIERGQVDARLRESDERQRFALQAAGAGAWDWDIAAGKIVWSPENYVLYDFDPALGPPGYADWESRVHPDDLACTNAKVHEAVEGRASEFRAEFRVVHRDGGILWLLGIGRMRRDASGTAVHLSGINLDITERKRADEALRQSHAKVVATSRVKDDFIAALSHELRTPLTPVLMAATELEMDPALPADVREQLSMMRRNIELEVQLIDDLLDLTRISNAKLQVVPVVTDLHRLLNHTAEIVRSEGRSKQVSTVFKLLAVRHNAMVDPTRCLQVFWNVIKNAIKFTPTGGSVTVSTRNDARGRILVIVEDTGIGISAEALPNIFNAFEQGAVGGQHRYGGLGLGLAISRAIVEAHHGAIGADSEGVGRGATFTIALDAVDAPATSARPSARAAPGRALRLLLVEDHEATRTTLTGLLTRRGHSVTAAGTIGEALDFFGDAHFDAVISDLGLPDGSGLDLMREIQRQRSVPAIALSGYGTEEDVRQAKEAGFFAHLVKPAKGDQLYQLLNRIAETLP